MADTKKILLVSAHPDDMEIGMGGTAAKLAAAGHSLLSVVITDGRRSPDPTGIGEVAMAALRQDEGVRACHRLGIEETRFLGLGSIIPDDAFRRSITGLADLIDRLSPDEVYTLHPGLDRPTGDASPERRFRPVVDHAWTGLT